MKNRAKCKLCNSIIESFHNLDFVSCKCGEIYVDGGEALRCGAGNFNNFVRVDDEGNEISVTYLETPTIEPQSTLSKPKLMDMLDSMIKYKDSLPEYVMLQPISHADFYSALLLIQQIFKAKE